MKDTPGSAYIRWAKSREGFRYNLGRSSIRPCPAEHLAARAEDFALAGDNAHGWLPLRERIAARTGVEPDQVVLAIGASMANHLACAALLEHGSHVLLESPGYEPLAALPAYLGAEVDAVGRRAEDGWALDVDAVDRAVQPGRTRLLILSDLHNPTGARCTPDTLGALAQLAERHDFHVLVDEVYLEFVPGATIAARRCPRFVSTSSLTKAFGLDGLRAGWIVAGHSLARRLRAINDLYGIIMPHPSERLAARALDRSDVILDAVRRLVASNRSRVAAFVEDRPELSWTLPDHGPVGLVRLHGMSASGLIAHLEQHHDCTAPPGEYFGAPDHFRLAFGMEPDDLEAGLDRLAASLDLLAR